MTSCLLCNKTPDLTQERKTSQYDRKRDDRKARPPSGRIINFTPLNSPLDHVLMQIRDNSALNWPKKFKRDKDKRSKEKYCHFHHDHGHDTSNCNKQKSQIEALIRKGKLQQFVKVGLGIQHPQGPEQLNRAEERPRAPLGEIKVIVGGTARLMA